MQLHLVGGFLGSGKTTAIITAARHLMKQGKKVGVVTNDQGKYLVDTNFLASKDIPAVEVTHGCFCCNYEDLEAKLLDLDASEKPDVVFAESVGSCGDLVATVIKPLLELEGSKTPPTSFTVFTDSRLLLAHLQGFELPFSENVIYIFEKQIEEAGLVVLNKADLLQDDEIWDIKLLANAAFPGKTIWLQDSTQTEDVVRWLNLLENGDHRLAVSPIEMDYQRYADGEMQLAWLDEELLIDTGESGVRQVVTEIIGGIAARLTADEIPVGHLKFFIRTPNTGVKVSITTLTDGSWQAGLKSMDGSQCRMLINARAEMAPEELQTLVQGVLDTCTNKTLARFEILRAEAFKPGFPQPTHRFDG